MGKIMAVVLVAAGLWWSLVGVNRMSDGDLHEFYSAEVNAMLSHDMGKLCKKMTDDFKYQLVVNTGGVISTSESNKDGACAEYADIFSRIERLERIDGYTSQISYIVNFEDYEISEGKDSIVVETTYTLTAPPSYLEIKGTATDTLVKRAGTVMLSERVTTEHRRGRITGSE